MIFLSGMYEKKKKILFDSHKSINIFKKCRLFMDKNRTFLQWSGDASYRTILQGRLILLKLQCLNSLPSFQNHSRTHSDEEDQLKPIQKLSPCISFRVTGSLLKHTTSRLFFAVFTIYFFCNIFLFLCFLPTDITEVQFALEPSDSGRESLSTNEYVIIAITSFCLGLMYIATVFLYIYFKKRKDRANNTSSENSDKNFSRGGEFIFSNLFQSIFIAPCTFEKEKKLST
jgi:hypothetical protein